MDLQEGWSLMAAVSQVHLNCSTNVSDMEHLADIATTTLRYSITQIRFLKEKSSEKPHESPENSVLVLPTLHYVFRNYFKYQLV